MNNLLYYYFFKGLFNKSTATYAWGLEPVKYQEAAVKFLSIVAFKKIITYFHCIAIN